MPAIINVAYAEDHTLVRKSVIQYMEQSENIKTIVEAENGRELIEGIEASAVLPDVCIIDVMMPEMNGFDTVARIKRKWGHMQILVLSSFIREEYIIRMILSGVNGYLSKNCHPKEISKALMDIQKCGLYNTELFTPELVSAVLNGKVELPRLTEKELQLLKWSITDMTYHQIADKMRTTSKSVEGYRNSLFVKLGVKSKVGLAMYAVRFGIVPLDFGVNPF